MRYIIIEGSSAAGVAQTVTAMLAEGWVCQGGISIAREHGSTSYCQAMVKS